MSIRTHHEWCAGSAAPYMAMLGGLRLQVFRVKGYWSSNVALDIFHIVWRFDKRTRSLAKAKNAALEAAKAYLTEALAHADELIVVEEK